MAVVRNSTSPVVRVVVDADEEVPLVILLAVVLAWQQRVLPVFRCVCCTFREFVDADECESLLFEQFLWHCRHTESVSVA